MKLVRDKIPKKYPDLICTLSNATLYGFAVRLKLAEETGEVLSAHTREQLIEELGDLFDVLDALIENEGLDMEEIDESRSAKVARLGGFNEGWILYNE